LQLTTTTIDWRWSLFDDLNLTDLYAILGLRQKVFIVEQRCAYQDIDQLDQKAWHLSALRPSNELVGYLRLLPPSITPDNKLTIGRVVVKRAWREQGIGRSLMQHSVDFCKKHFNGVPIHLSAQLHTQIFYREQGFVAVGKEYDLDGISHIDMVRQPG
jgi:ElaA protein|tara:strand:+ start:49 stop:522 length:474 start_codon:yes stop_codon:yes gene_type:complete